MSSHDTIRKLNLSEIDGGIVDEAVSVIKYGGVIFYPTDTIYGLGCDAFNTQAVGKIYAIKKRPSNQPVLVLIGSLRFLHYLAEEITDNAKKLMNALWPGPVTFVFRAKSSVPRCILSADGKIGIRLPKHEFCRRLCDLSGVPLLSTSANISGIPQTGNIDILKKLFAGEVDLFMDAGNCTSITTSTLVDISGKDPVILRDGVISREEIGSVLHRPSFK